MSGKPVPPKIVAINPPPPEIAGSLPGVSDGGVMAVKPETSLNASIPGVGDSIVQIRDTETASMPGELPGVGDSGISTIGKDSPAIPRELPSVGDSISGQRVVDSLGMPDELPGVSDSTVSNITRQLAFPSNLPDVGDLMSGQKPIISPAVPENMPPVSDGEIRHSDKGDIPLPSNLPEVRDEATDQWALSSPNIPGEFPNASDLQSTQRPVGSPSVGADFPGTSDGVIPIQKASSPSVPDDLPEARDEVFTQRVTESHELPLSLPDAGDVRIGHEKDISPLMPADFPGTSDGVIISERKPLIAMPDDLPGTADGFVLQEKPAPASVSHELPGVNDERSAQGVAGSPKIPDALPQTGDVTIPTVRRETGINPEMLGVSDGTRPHVRKLPPEIPRELPESADGYVIKERKLQSPGFGELPAISENADQVKFREFSFTGRWVPNLDTLNANPKDYSVLKNFRYKDDGLEGVGGFQPINTSGAGKQLMSGIQLRTNYSAQRSVVLVQATDTTSGESVIIDNTAAVPAVKDFSNYNAFTIVNSVNDLILMYSVCMGHTSVTAAFSLTAGEYTGASLATHLQARMMAQSWLVQSLMTFTVTWASQKFTITATGGTVAFSRIGSTVGTTIGFTVNQGPSVSLLSDTEVSNEDAFYAEDTGATLARFAHLPQGNIGMCDGKVNRIWAGDEMPVGAFWAGSFGTSSMESGTKSMVFTSSPGETATIALTETTAYTCDELATLLQNTMNASSTLTNTGHVTFAVTNQMGRFKIDAGTGHTISYDFTGSTAYDMFGFTNDLVAAQTITGNAPASRGSLHPYFNLSLMQDVTKKLQNTATDSDNIVTLGNSGSDKFFLVGSNRPISGMNITVSSGTLNASVLTVKYCDGKGFVTVGTITNGATMGSVTFSDTSSLAKPIYVGGYYQYFYLCEISGSGTPVVSHITVNAPFQGIVNLWDGLHRTTTKCELFRTKYIDYTLKAANEADLTTAAAADIDFMITDTNNTITLMFSEQIIGLKIKLNQPIISTTLKGYAKITYHSNTGSAGTAFVYLNEPGPILIPLQGDGVIAWEKPTDEEPTYYKGVKGYKYTLEWYASDSTSQINFTQTAANCPVIDTITGITAYKTITIPYTFPFQYRNRAMWCGCISDGELNRVDYGPANTVDVYNGDDSSKFDSSQALYFGSKNPLTGAAEIFNTFGQTLASGALFFKNTKTYLLLGDAPGGSDPFKNLCISEQIGCPCPLSITHMEVCYTTGDQPPANIVGWISDKGPILYYNTNLYSVPGVEPYFEPGHALCINTLLTDNYLRRAAAGYDSFYREWNIVFPSVSATECNTWLVYDLVRHKWYERVTASSDFPQGFITIEDVNGNKYLYAYTNTGYLMRLEYGMTDNGTALINTVKTADVMPFESMWTRSTINKVKTLFKAQSVGTLTITHYLDGDSTGTTVESTASNMVSSDASLRYKNLISKVYGTITGPPEQRYALSGLSHAFQFQVTGAISEKPKLLGYGTQNIFYREDTF